MKKLLSLIIVSFVVFGLRGQVVEYEMEGFVNENDEIIHDMNLVLNEDFAPRVKIKNNGPELPHISDTLFFDVFVNDNFAGMMYLRGSQLQNILPGQSGIISWSNPIYDAAVMDMSYMTAFAFCFELRLEGQSTDPDASNNRGCVQVSRPLAVGDYAEVGMSVYPNPATDICYVEMGELTGDEMSVVVYDLYGKVVKVASMRDGVASIEMGGLASGLYLLKLVREGKVLSTGKVIKR